MKTKVNVIEILLQMGLSMEQIQKIFKMVGEEGETVSQQ